MNVSKMADVQKSITFLSLFDIKVNPDPLFEREGYIAFIVNNPVSDYWLKFDTVAFGSNPALDEEHAACNRFVPCRLYTGRGKVTGRANDRFYGGDWFIYKGDSIDQGVIRLRLDRTKHIVTVELTDVTQQFSD